MQLALTLVDDLEEVSNALELLCSLPDDEALLVAKTIGRQTPLESPDSFVHDLAEAIRRSTAMMPVGVTEPTMHMQEFLPISVDIPARLAVLLDKLVKTPRGISVADKQKAWNLLFGSLARLDLRDRLYSMLSSRDRDERWKKNTDVEIASTKQSYRTALRKRDAALQTAQKGRDRFPTGRRALKVLQSRRSVIDLRIALEVAEKYGHDPCPEYLYEHLQMYRELGICLRAGGNWMSLLSVFGRHGDKGFGLITPECINLYAPLLAGESDEEEDSLAIVVQKQRWVGLAIIGYNASYFRMTEPHFVRELQAALSQQTAITARICFRTHSPGPTITLALSRELFLLRITSFWMGSIIVGFEITACICDTSPRALGIPRYISRSDRVDDEGLMLLAAEHSQLGFAEITCWVMFALDEVVKDEILLIPQTPSRPWKIVISNVYRATGATTDVSKAKHD